MTFASVRNVNLFLSILKYVFVYRNYQYYIEDMDYNKSVLCFNM